MNICPNCNRNNRDGALLCDYCGHSLSDAAFEVLRTRVVQGNRDSDALQWHGNSSFTQDTQIILYVRGEKSPLVLPQKQRLVLGRLNAGHIPDVDLSPFGAFEKGVSTRHAALERGSDQLMIIDLRSTNGTYLNRVPVEASIPTQVLDGAEVQLGDLILRLYFETTACAIP